MDYWKYGICYLFADLKGWNYKGTVWLCNCTSRGGELVLVRHGYSIFGWELNCFFDAFSYHPMSPEYASAFWDILKKIYFGWLGYP